ncbi:MAG: DEAD/DEAH box helicase [Phycisphaerales bacterium]
MKPRPYQQDAIDAIARSFETHRSALAVLATGLGKTVIFSHVAKRMVAGTHRGVMVLAHREELITQAANKLEAITGIMPDIEMGDQRADLDGFHRSPIIVSSIQTQIAGRGDRRRMHRFDPNRYGLVIVDEAHRAVADSYRRVLEHYRTNENLRVLGVTATPDRRDEKALGLEFDTVAFEMGIREGIIEGWLVPIRQQLVTVDSLDYSGIKTQLGDLHGAELAQVLEYEQNLHAMCDPTIEIVGSRRSLVFTKSVAQAQRVCEILNRHRSGCAAMVDGKTPKDDRRALFRRYADGDFQFLVNVEVATEGFDDPGVECIVMMRPTKSRALYSQMVGRGTRSLEGTLDALGEAGPADRKGAIAASSKPGMLVVDFVGNAGHHKLVHAGDVLGGDYDDEVRELADREATEKGGERDVMDDLVRAEKKKRQMEEAREARRRAAIRAKAKYRTESVDPFEAAGIEAAPLFGDQADRMASRKQADLLRKFGVPNPETLTSKHAGQLIDAHLNRPSPKQAKVLERYYPAETVQRLNRKKASKVIDAIASNGWRAVPIAEALEGAVA